MSAECPSAEEIAAKVQEIAQQVDDKHALGLLFVLPVVALIAIGVPAFLYWIVNKKRSNMPR
jgi:hypothetical protein